MPVSRPDAKHRLGTFWNDQLEKMHNIDSNDLKDLKNSQATALPLARIKKIMKIDDDVRLQMISAEVPLLFSKAVEMFIEELTMRALVHTEEGRLKTLSKNHVTMAVGKEEHFDFLIDVVPREEVERATAAAQGRHAFEAAAAPMSPSQVTVPLQVTNGSPVDPQVAQFRLDNGQVLQPMQFGQPIQLINANTLDNPAAAGSNASQPIQVQLPGPSSQGGNQQVQFVDPSLLNIGDGQAHVLQQVHNPDGTTSFVPVTNYSSNQLSNIISSICPPTSTTNTASVPASSHQGQSQPVFLQNPTVSPIRVQVNTNPHNTPQQMRADHHLQAGASGQPHMNAGPSDYAHPVNRGHRGTPPSGKQQRRG